MRSSMSWMVAMPAAMQARPCGERDEFGPSVRGVRVSLDVAEFLEFVDEFSHCLRGDVGATGQFGQSAALWVDLGEDG